jgi:demethylmenaquinone methyltransferase/2-methoxy-6-polyprenyl-1,4-benzoquinol methylase
MDDTASSSDEPSARTRHARRLFADLPARYDLLAEMLSFGQNGRWRRAMVEAVRRGLDGQRAPVILDVATGTAGVAIALTRATSARVVGLDQSREMLAGGVRRVTDEGLSGRVDFVLGQAERLPFPDESFDAVTFTYLLRYVDDPQATLHELTRVLKPGGVLANLEFAVPSNAVWLGLWFAYTRVGLPAAGRVASKSWYDVGRFLGPSISTFYRRHPPGEQLAMWCQAGIEAVHARPMSLGGGVVISGTKRERARAVA